MKLLIKYSPLIRRVRVIQGTLKHWSCLGSRARQIQDLGNVWVPASPSTPSHSDAKGSSSIAIFERIYFSWRDACLMDCRTWMMIRDMCNIVQYPQSIFSDSNMPWKSLKHDEYQQSFVQSIACCYHGTIAIHWFSLVVPGLGPGASWGSNISASFGPTKPHHVADASPHFRRSAGTKCNFSYRYLYHTHQTHLMQ